MTAKTNLERVYTIVAIVGGVVGIVGGLAGGWIYYRNEIAHPPVFQLIGVRLVDADGYDVTSQLSRYWSDGIDEDVTFRWEMAFSYFNATDRYVQPSVISPQLPDPDDPQFGNTEVERLVAAQVDLDPNCYLSGFDSAVGPYELKSLVCQTRMSTGRHKGYGLILESSDSTKGHPLADTWFFACAVWIYMADTSDANLPSAYGYNHPNNIVGGGCIPEL